MADELRNVLGVGGGWGSFSATTGNTSTVAALIRTDRSITGTMRWARLTPSGGSITITDKDGTNTITVADGVVIDLGGDDFPSISAVEQVVPKGVAGAVTVLYRYVEPQA